jgi:hypothetical protein
MAKRNWMNAPGAAALSLAAMGTMAPAMAAPLIEQDHVIVVNGEGTAAVANSSGSLPVLSEDHARWAFGALFGSLFAGLVGMVGPNRILNWFVGAADDRSLRVVSTRSGNRSRLKLSPKVAATLKSSGQTLGGVAMIAGFVVGIAILLDLQWKAGAVLGAGAAVAGAAGWVRGRYRRRSSDRAAASPREYATAMA